jgi:hypothetical protein
MQRRLVPCAVLTGLAVLVAAPAAAQPPLPYIVAMAQHFVQDRLMTSESEHHHIEFDRAFVYSQPRKTLWVVIGGYVSDQNKFNSFTAAVVLDCPDFEKVDCWSLEKLSINGQIVLNRKRI